MGEQITEHQIKMFEQDGAICIRNLLNDAQLETLKIGAHKAMSIAPTDPGMYYFKRIRLWQKISQLKEICTESHLPRIAATMLRTKKLNLLYDQLFVKDTTMVERTTWHNDQPYWPVRGGSALSLWIAVEDLDASMGTLEFIRGSHLWNAWYQPLIGSEHGTIKSMPEAQKGYMPMPDFEAERDQHEMIMWDLNAGDAIVFNALTIHGSTGNTSSNAIRWAYSIRYAGKENRYFDVRNIPGHNIDLENPTLKTNDPLDSEMFPVVYQTT